MAHLDEIVEGLFEARMNFIGEVPYEGEKRMRKKVTQLMACVLVVLLIMTLLPELSGGKAYALHHQHSGWHRCRWKFGRRGSSKGFGCVQLFHLRRKFFALLMIRFSAMYLSTKYGSTTIYKATPDIGVAY